MLIMLTTPHIYPSPLFSAQIKSKPEKKEKIIFSHFFPFWPFYCIWGIFNQFECIDTSLANYYPLHLFMPKVYIFFLWHQERNEQYS